VHHLICETFHGPRPINHDAAHWDGDIANNREDNLRWATKVENAADKIRHGTHRAGENIPWAKLSNDAVREMRLLYNSKIDMNIIAEQFGVSYESARDACLGKTWAHIDDACESRPPQLATGERHWDARLTVAQVLTMRTLNAAGKGYADLARQFGITPRAAKNVCLRISWKHI